jgi:hypothetical protein
VLLDLGPGVIRHARVDFVYGSTTTLSGIVVRPGVFLDISTIWKLFVGSPPGDWQLAEQVLHI